jgi:Transposase DDE domain
MLSSIFERFIEASPVTVMLRATLERIFSAEKLDELFEVTREKQYTQELLFSTVVGIMSLVVCNIRPSVNAAYKAFSKQIGVSRVAFYSKINGIEPTVSQALVRYSSKELAPIIEELGGKQPPILPGYRIKIIDGNNLAATEHRLSVLRDVYGGPLPGKSLVVLDPILMLAIDQFPCEDAYTQERALFSQVLETVEKNDVWVGDRNFCTCMFLVEIAKSKAYFVIRQHASMPYEELGELKEIGDSPTGKVFEQDVLIEYERESIKARRVVVRLNEPTRDGDAEVAVFCNLRQEDTSGIVISNIYLKRWSVEGLFQVVSDTLECEIKTLGYPRAALFSFCMALVAYNILSVIKAALRSVHGQGKIDAGVSNYYLVEEIQSTYTGMMIAIPDVEWKFVTHLSLPAFAELLKQWAAKVDLKRFASSPKARKKSQPKREREPNRPHVSTARLLADKQRESKHSSLEQQTSNLVETPLVLALET